MNKSRKVSRLICKICGREYESNKSNGLYCSEKCQRRAYRIRHREEIKKSCILWRGKNKERAKEYYKRKNLENPNRQKAHHFVLTNIRNGNIVKPTQCENCKRPGYVEAHHYLGYEKEHWLDIKWLCRSCHKTLENGNDS